MPVVKLPDGNLVNIPDDATQEQLLKLRDMYAPKQEASTPVQLEADGQEAPLVKQAARQLVSPEMSAKAMEIAKPIDTGLRKGLLFLPTLGHDTGKAIGKLLQQKLGIEPMQGEFADKVREIRGKVDKYLHPEESKDPTAKIAENLIASTSGALVAPGNVLLNAGAGLSGGIGAETAAKVFGDNPLSRIAGSLLGSGLHGFATQEFTNRGALAREMLDDVKPEDLSTAMLKQREAAKAGIPIDLSQAMDSPSNIDVYRNTLANTAQGKNVAKILRDQPAQVNMAAEDFMHRLPGDLVTKHQSANAFQDNMTDIIGGLYKQNSQNWRTTHDAAAKVFGTDIPEASLKQAYDQIITEAKKYSSKDELHQKLVELAERLKDNGRWITDGRKLNDTLRDMKDSFSMQTIGNRGVSTNTGKYISKVINDLKASVGQGFEPMRQADKVYADYKQTIIDPMKKSVIGRFATRQGAMPDREAALTQLTRLFREGTTPGTPSDILKVADEFNKLGRGQDFVDAVKSHFAEQISQAGRRETNRINEDLPKNLTKLFGSPSDSNPITQGTKEQLIGVARVMNIPDEKHYAEGFRRLMDIVSRTANRPSNVSGTSSHAIEQAAEGSLFKRLGQFSFLTPIRQPALAWSTLLKKDSLGTIDKMITDPDQVANLILLGKQPEMNPTAQKAITAVLTAGINSQGGQGKE